MVLKKVFATHVSYSEYRNTFHFVIYSLQFATYFSVGHISFLGHLVIFEWKLCGVKSPPESQNLPVCYIMVNLLHITEGGGTDSDSTSPNSDSTSPNSDLIPTGRNPIPTCRNRTRVGFRFRLESRSRKSEVGMDFETGPKKSKVGFRLSRIPTFLGCQLSRNPT